MGALLLCSSFKLLRELIDKRRQSKKKRTKELDFLSPALSRGHKASTLPTPELFLQFFLESSAAFNFKNCFVEGCFQRSANHVKLCRRALIWAKIGSGGGIQDQPEDLDRYTNLLWEPPR